MYGHTNHTFSRTTYTADFPSPDFITPLPFPLPSAQLIVADQLAGTEFDSVREAMRSLNSEMGNSSSSNCSSYDSPSSISSYGTQTPSLIQRSASSHSLQKNGHHCPFASFLESETGPVRRVFSTGDLQRVNMGQRTHRSESPLSNESSAAIIEGMSRACRYSPEEKKERIERYKSKRNQRNFTKKIKYVCRKTLADSRPRIRGRFARNEEIEKNSQVQWNQIGGEEEEEEDDNWVNFLEAFSANLIP